jgi:trehalose transport system substrate-binding protein
MKKGKLWLCGAAVCAASAFVLIGCSKAKSADGSAAAKKISFGIALSEEEWKVMREDVFPKFTAKTGIEVQGLQIENADIETKVESLKGRGEIDVIAPDNMLLYGLVKKGLIKDLSAHESSIPAEITKSNYEFYKINGKLYFLPFRPNVKINFYNETKFNAAGLQPPKTWDELLVVGKKFFDAEKTGRIGLQANQGAPTTVEMFEFIRAAGGDPLVLNDEGSVKAYSFLKELWPYVSRESLRSNFAIINQALATDAVYYASNWPFTVNVVVQDGQKTEIKANAGFAGPVKMSKVLGGNVLAVCADTASEEAALDFCKFLVSKEIQEVFVSKNAWPAVRGDAYGAIADWQQPYFKAVNEALEFAEPRPIVAYWSDVDKAINDSFKAIVIDGGDVKSNLDKFASQIAAAKSKAE